MLYFRDHHWLLILGTSRFEVSIDPPDTCAEDLRWHLFLSYAAGGAKWRRVRSWERPRMRLELFNFRPRIRRWTDLERVNFWEFVPYDEEYWGGTLCMAYEAPGEESLSELSGDQIWRVAARDRRWLTVEFAHLADPAKFEELTSAPAVAPDGEPIGSERDFDFWKAHAQIYLVEEVPFGVVTVGVPRNVRDPEAYALGRTRTLLGLERPEHLEVHDYSLGPNPSRLTAGNLYVQLHFHGYYED
jgi:hypothetical protein